MTAAPHPTTNLGHNPTQPLQPPQSIMQPLAYSHSKGNTTSQSYSLLEKQLLESVKSSLQFELYSNASFLCERLLAQSDNEEIRLLLAESYLGDGKAYKAYDVLKGSTSSANRYKLALTCLKLNKLAEAEKVLLDQTNIRSLSLMDPDQLKKVPNGAAGLYLLG